MSVSTRVPAYCPKCNSPHFKVAENFGPDSDLTCSNCGHVLTADAVKQMAKELATSLAERIARQGLKL